MIATERNDARRIDRQLYGRCARQGDPGSNEAFLSLDDAATTLYYPRVLLRILALFAPAGEHLPIAMGMKVVTLPQRRTERLHCRARRQLLKMDRQLSQTLAYSGRLE